MSKPTTVWLRPPHGQGEPEEVEATPQVLVPRLVAGWAQCSPPPKKEKQEVKPDVDS
ncbi:MAG TPA: hypothetical protein PLZ95_22545 [Bryobacteraceae bacterium]|nr:hypothetical protein [Bryobacteraceae bacterium]